MPVQKKSRGFTLIELMVVVAIISILASIGIAVYSGAQKKARDSRKQQEILEVQKAIEQYYAINNKYPDDQALLYSSAATGMSNSDYFAKGETPKNPKTNAEYSYFRCVSPANKYTLCTNLEILDTGTTDTLPSTGCESANAISGGSKDYFCVNALQ